MIKVLIPLEGEEVAPRFDLSTEVWVGWVNRAGRVDKSRLLMLTRASAEDLCQLIIEENAEIVICGGIEAEYYDYLTWKKVRVYDSVIANYREALQHLAAGDLATAGPETES